MAASKPGRWEPKPVAGRKPRERAARLPAQEVARRMLLQAREVVWQRGLVASPGDLNMEDLIRDAEVPRSSVFRIWPFKGDFIDALMMYLAAPDEVGLRASAFDEATLDCARQVITANLELLTKAEGRRAVVREAIRVAAEQNFLSIADSPQWGSYIALVATVRSIPSDDTRKRLAAQLYESERGFFIERMAAFYRDMSALMGMRPRPGFTFEHVAVAGAAVVEGFAIKELLSRHVPDDRSEHAGPQPTLHQVIRDPVPGPGLDGSPAAWAPAALGFLAVFEAMIEFDSDATIDLEALSQQT